MKENAIEWLTGDQVATVTLSQQKYINRIRRIAKIDPDSVAIIEEPETNGGYLVAHIDVELVSLRLKQRLSDEARKSKSDRLKALRASKNATKQGGAP